MLLQSLMSLLFSATTLRYPTIPPVASPSPRRSRCSIPPQTIINLDQMFYVFNSPHLGFARRLTVCQTFFTTAKFAVSFIGPHPRAYVTTSNPSPLNQPATSFETEMFIYCRWLLTCFYNVALTFSYRCRRSAQRCRY